MAQTMTSPEPQTCAQPLHKPRGLSVSLCRDLRVRFLARSTLIALSVSLNSPQARATYRSCFLMLDRPEKPSVTAPKSPKSVVRTVRVDKAHPDPRTNPSPHRQASQNAHHLPPSKSSNVAHSPEHPRAVAVSPQKVGSISTASMPVVSASVPSAVTLPGLNPSVSAS